MRRRRRNPKRKSKRAAQGFNLLSFAKKRALLIGVAGVATYALMRSNHAQANTLPPKIQPKGAPPRLKGLGTFWDWFMGNDTSSSLVSVKNQPMHVPIAPTRGAFTIDSEVFDGNMNSTGTWQGHFADGTVVRFDTMGHINATVQ